MQIIDAYINKSNRCSVKDNLWAWDYGITLQIHGASFTSAPKVHFLREFETKNIPVQSNIDGDVLAVKIPDELLQSESNINFRLIALLYSEHIDPDWGRTKIEIEIPVKARPKPENYIYTPEEIKTWDKLEKGKADKIEIEDQTIKLMSGDNVLSSVDLPGAFIVTVSEDEEGYLHATSSYDEIISALDKGQTVYAELDTSVKLKFGDQDLSGFNLRLDYDSTYNGTITFYGKLADKLYSYLTIANDTVEVNVFFENTEAVNTAIVITGLCYYNSNTLDPADGWYTETTYDDVVNYIKAGITCFILNLRALQNDASIASNRTTSGIYEGVYYESSNVVLFYNRLAAFSANIHYYSDTDNSLVLNKIQNLCYEIKTESDHNLIKEYADETVNNIGLIEYSKNTYKYLWNRDTYDYWDTSKSDLASAHRENEHTEFVIESSEIKGTRTPKTVNIDEDINFPLRLRILSTFYGPEASPMMGVAACGVDMHGTPVMAIAMNGKDTNSIDVYKTTDTGISTTITQDSDGNYKSSLTHEQIIAAVNRNRVVTARGTDISYTVYDLASGLSESWDAPCLFTLDSVAVDYIIFKSTSTYDLTSTGRTVYLYVVIDPNDQVYTFGYVSSSLLPSATGMTYGVEIECINRTDKYSYETYDDKSLKSITSNVICNNTNYDDLIAAIDDGHFLFNIWLRNDLRITFGVGYTLPSFSDMCTGSIVHDDELDIDCPVLTSYETKEVYQYVDGELKVQYTQYTLKLTKDTAILTANYTYSSVMTVDDALSDKSENAVQNKVIKAALDGKQDTIPVCKMYSETSQIYKIDTPNGESLADLLSSKDIIIFLLNNTERYIYQGRTKILSTGKCYYADYITYGDNSVYVSYVAFTVSNGKVTWEWKSGSAGFSYTIDDALNNTSKRPVQNKVITKALAEKASITQLNEAIGNITSFDIDAGPDSAGYASLADLKTAHPTGAKGVFYLVQGGSGGEDNSFLEYFWTGTSYELAGKFGDVDTSALATKIEVEEGLAEKASTTELTEGLAKKQDAGDYATTTELTEGLEKKVATGTFNKQRIISITNSCRSRLSPWTYDDASYTSNLTQYLADVHYPYDDIMPLTYNLDSDCNKYYYINLSTAFSDYDDETYNNGVQNPATTDGYQAVIYDYTRVQHFAELRLLSDVSDASARYDINRKYAYINLNGHVISCSRFSVQKNQEGLLYDPVGGGQIKTALSMTFFPMLGAIINGTYTVPSGKVIRMGYSNSSLLGVIESKYPYDKNNVICYGAQFEGSIQIWGNAMPHHTQYVEFDKCSVVSKNSIAICSMNNTFSFNALLKNSTFTATSSDSGDATPAAIRVFANVLILDNCVCESTNNAVAGVSKHTLIVNSLLSGAGHGGIYTSSGTTYVQNSTLRKLDGSTVIPTSDNPYAAYFGYRSLVYCDNVTFDCLYNKSYGRPAIRKEGSLKTVHVYFSNCTMQSIRVDAGTNAHMGQGMDYLKNTSVSGTIVDEGDESYSWTYGVNYGTSEYQTIIDEVLANTKVRHSHNNKEIIDSITSDKVTVWDAKADKTDIPTIPESLKNPAALTIKIGSTEVTYDGSTAQSITIEDGTEVEY